MRCALAVFGIFRRREHPHRRELRGLTACMLAFRRSMLEEWHRGGQPSLEKLEEKRSALAWYARGAGGTDRFSTHVVNTPIGRLDQPLFLLAMYRIDAAISIAWALGLAERVPAIGERASFELLDRLLPLQGDPEIRAAKLRDETELRKKLDEWKQLLPGARQRRESSPGEEGAAVEFSRAYERTRGLAWCLSGANDLEEVDFEF